MRKRFILLAALGFAAIGSTLAQTAAATPSSPTVRTALAPALQAPRRALDLPGFGRVAYYYDVSAPGRPLILTHSVNAAASAYEMKPIFEAFRGKRPVYALEWPGFGTSDRPDVNYTPELMSSALSELVRQLGQDVDVVSLSLGSEFAARAALGEPRIRSLALLSPSGLGLPRGTSQTETRRQADEQYARFLPWRDPLYSVIRSEPSIYYFLSRSFERGVDGGVYNYAVRTSRQPGAANAPLHFISGRLFTPDAYGELYSKLQTPTLVLYDEDAFVSFERLPQFGAQPGVSVVRVAPTKGLAQFDETAKVVAALEQFYGTQP
ncbi:alpha/beta fold hydrolase [Deinococcus lacus]|uniref:Alpha/beta fold hydrolase n=1 Tax=Deinococcus lacus TaxID=392561 RepID=A0ABW1YEW8_9DEIO